MTRKAPQLSELVDALVRSLKQRPVSGPDDDALDKILSFVRDVPPAARPTDLRALLVEKFRLEEDALDDRLDPKHKIPEFDNLVPSSGWIADYIEYTRQTEPPTVFHFFVGMVALGSALQRNVYVRMGHNSIFPNLCVVLVAPSGKCRKTTACNIGVEFVRKFGGMVIADKITPEAIIESFKEKERAIALMYAPELAAMLGKQKYLDGMIPMLTSLFDSPQMWTSTTITRGEVILNEVALSFLGASTLDWMQTAIPADAFGGGFMSRILFVVQEMTPRSFAIPPPPDLVLQRHLFGGLVNMTKTRGEIPFYDKNPDTREWYEHWYNTRYMIGSTEKQFAGYSERKPTHMIRMAMLLAASDGNPFDLKIRHMERALKILDWLEMWLPSTFEQLVQSAIGEDHRRMLNQLRAAGGGIEHSKWLRLNSTKMDARMFRERCDTMRQAKLVEFDSKTRRYLLTPEGWK